MSFFSKVKNVLLENNARELASIDARIAEIEKEYQNGGNALRNKGYKVIALASIKEMAGNIIQFN